MSAELVYLVSLGLGLAYAVLSAALGWLLGHGHGGDVHLDGHDIHIGGHDIHIDGGDADAGHPHAASGPIVATFLTGFGGAGTIAEGLLEWSLVPGFAVAVASGLMLAAASLGIMGFVFSRTQAGSEFTAADAVGRVGEVITPIPAGGVGEIAYVVKGQREHAGARAEERAAVAKGTRVIIDKMDGPTAWVRPAD